MEKLEITVDTTEIQRTIRDLGAVALRKDKVLNFCKCICDQLSKIIEKHIISMFCFFFSQVPCISHFQWTLCALDFNHTLPRSLYVSCPKQKHHHFQHPSCIHPYNQTSCIPCIGKRILNHWTTREVLPQCIFKALWWYNRTSLI